MSHDGGSPDSEQSALSDSQERRIRKLAREEAQEIAGLSVENGTGGRVSLDDLIANYGLSRRGALQVMGLLALGYAVPQAVARVLVGTADAAASGTLGSSGEPWQQLFADTIGSTSTPVNTTHYGDDDTIIFGGSDEWALLYDTADDRLEFRDQVNNTEAYLPRSASGDLTSGGGGNTGDPVVYDPGMTNWEDGLSNEEINRIALQSGEVLRVERIEFRQKGGGSSASASIDVRDTGAASTIGSQDLGGTTKDAGDSGSGNTIIVRLTNLTGGAIDAAPRVIGSIEGS